MRTVALVLLAVVTVLGSVAPARAESVVAHGLALHGDLKYGPDFEHFEYANPAAPKAGTARLAAIGTFDNLNPFILRGISPSGIGNLFDTLMVSSADEAFSVYGLIAESVEVPPDHSWVAFTLRPEARFHDGSPITVADVIFTLEILRTQGHPFYRSYYADVVTAEQTAARTVRFTFRSGENRELPLTLGQMPVLSKAYWSEREFDRTTLEPPLGSGPYRIESAEPGRAITYRRVEDYWAKDLPVNRGRYNFDRIRFDYYRDATVALEAFKAGQYDFRQENVARDWATGYEGPALRQGLVKMEEIRHEQPTGMQGFVFNTRRAVFADPRVRKALGYAFDFEWTNRNLFNGAYARTTSYFSNSELAASGLPSAEELSILERYRGRLPEEVFTRAYQPPDSDGSGNVRSNLRRAFELLEDAGWVVNERGRLVHAESGWPMQFEILLVNPSFERIALPYTRNLNRLGITARVRTVDTTQYQNRLDNYDFDMTVTVWGQSLSPGNEQRDLWSSEKAEVPGSRNLAGIRDPVIDELVERLIAAADRERLIHHARALDRVLLWGHYVVPHWHVRAFRVAYWDKFSRPETPPRYALGFDTWWVDPVKEAQLNRARNVRVSR
jgi:microcin C transport system substrate-binding protein